MLPRALLEWRIPDALKIGLSRLRSRRGGSRNRATLGALTIGVKLWLRDTANRAANLGVFSHRTSVQNGVLSLACLKWRTPDAFDVVVCCFGEESDVIFVVILVKVLINSDGGRSA